MEEALQVHRVRKQKGSGGNLPDVGQGGKGRAQWQADAGRRAGNYRARRGGRFHGGES